MQAGRPYQDRLFPSGQFHHAIAGCSHSRQFYRVHVATTNGAIAPVSHFRQFCSLPLKGRVRERSDQGMALLI